MANYDNDYSDQLEEVNSTLSEIRSTLKSRTDFSGLVVAAFVIFIIENWSGSALDRWTDKKWYSYRYDTDAKNITVEKRPLDCDFLHVPLGGKGCQYKKRTNIFGDEQRRALVQRATTPQERRADGQLPNTVAVYWEKEED